MLCLSGAGSKRLPTGLLRIAGTLPLVTTANDCASDLAASHWPSANRGNASARHHRERLRHLLTRRILQRTERDVRVLRRAVVEVRVTRLVGYRAQEAIRVARNRPRAARKRRVVAPVIPPVIPPDIERQSRQWSQVRRSRRAQRLLHDRDARRPHVI